MSNSFFCSHREVVVHPHLTQYFDIIAYHKEFIILFTCMYKEIYLSKEYIAQYVYSSKKNTLFIKYSVLMKIVKLQILCLDCI